MLNLFDKLQRLSEMGRSSREKQELINVNEVFYIWDIVVNKYDILETIQIEAKYIHDKDLALLNGKMTSILTSGIEELEKLLHEYDIPFPERPPLQAKTTANVEDIRDRYIFTSMYESIHSFFPILGSAFMNSTSPKIRRILQDHLLLTMDFHNLLVEYGKLKGYLPQAPAYRP